jgi:hypothetical protein
MKPEDEQPTEEELREAAALAAALAQDRAPADAPAEAIETAALLRHARAPLAVPPAHEPIAAAEAGRALDARRARRPRRRRVWIAASVVAPPAAAAAWLLFATTLRAPSRQRAPLPPPTADLLAAQAEATRGGSGAGAALARLDAEMRIYRRRYHEGLRSRGGGAP